MLRVAILLIAVASVIGSPLDYFRFAVTYNDTETSYQPFYLNLTSTGDFFLKAFGTTLTSTVSRDPNAEVQPEVSQETSVGGLTTQDSLMVVTKSPFDGSNVETNIV